MDENKITDRVIKVIRMLYGKSEDDEMEPEDDLVEDMGSDSLRCVELTLKIEEEFEIETPDIKAEQVSTVQNVIDCVKGFIGTEE